MKKKIRRRCKCGCGEITNYGKTYVLGHHWRNKKHTDETKEKMSLAKKRRKHTDETRRKMSLAKMGNTYTLGKKLSAKTKEKMSLAKKGRKHTDEHILNRSLATMKYDPNDPYCDAWKDREYKKDIRKDYCENADCKKISKRLHNHHIHLDKKRCAPIDIMTLCNSCHMVLHNKLRQGNKSADPKDFIVINRSDHVSYIHKKSREIIKINN